MPAQTEERRRDDEKVRRGLNGMYETGLMELVLGPALDADVESMGRISVFHLSLC